MKLLYFQNFISYSNSGKIYLLNKIDFKTYLGALM